MGPFARENEMLDIVNVSKNYKNTPVLEHINFKIDVGDFAILTGRSGGGKTTLLSMAGGLTRPDSGEILLDGVDLNKLSDRELAGLRNRKMGFVFQFPSLIPTLTVRDNILLPIAFSGRTPSVSDLERANELMELTGIADRRDHYPAQLSGGQQRRTALARAMINNPPLLLADEPTGDLDEQSEAAIMDLFRTINKQGTTIFMVTHALNYVDYGTAYTLKNGLLEPFTAIPEPHTQDSCHES